MTTMGMQLFHLLKGRLGERETEALINFVDVKIKENNKETHEVNLRTLATKEDITNTKEDIANLKQELTKVESRLEVKIVEMKSDIIRWIFAIFVAIILAIIGLYFKH